MPLFVSLCIGGADRAVSAPVHVRDSSGSRLQRKLTQLARVDVVILDELGYVPFDKAGADLLFGFSSQRYERRSLVVTRRLEDPNPIAPRSPISSPSSAATRGPSYNNAYLRRLVP